MKSTFKFELRDAFVVRTEPLKKVYELLCERIGKTTITAECADDVTREFDSFNKLEQYENAKSKRILNLRLRATDEDWKKEATIEFTDKWYFGGIQIKVQARDDVVTRLRSELLDIVAGLRPWYHMINRFDIVTLAGVGLGTASVLLLIWNATYGPDEVMDKTPRQQAVALLVGVGFVAIYSVLFYMLHRFRKVVFPHGTFAFGQEIHRIETAEKWRWGLLIAFLASLAAGIVLLWFQN